MADDKKTPPTAPEKVPDPNEGPGKGKAFFDRAKTVAATGNYDYAIDMYIEGLFREPFNVPEHTALREVAFSRKLKGGKAAGGLLGPKLPYKGKTPKEALLNNEFLLAKDFGNITAMLAIIRNAVLLELKDLVMWLGPILQQANATTKTPKLETFMELADIYESIGEFSKASEALQGAINLRPNDMGLIAKAKDLSARETLKKGNYEGAGSFRDSIKDQESTKKLNEEENLGKSEEYLLRALEAAKADYEKNPMELQVIAKYSKALADMEREEYENQAIDVLAKGFAQTHIYRLKMGQGDIRIRQFRRNLRLLADSLKSNSGDKELLHQYEELNKERLAYELAEFQERSEHMPTDMVIKYQLGVRYWETKNYDQAIVALQEGQNNPKHRVDALHLLGRAFLIQSMTPEAVETLKRSIDEYDLAATGDRKAKELYYYYALALEQNGNAEEAIVMFSKIVQWEMGYKDARKHLIELRAKLGGGAPPTA